MFELEKKEALHGIEVRADNTCKSSRPVLDEVLVMLTLCRRTYGNEDEGEVVREGFDPQQLKPDHSSSADHTIEEESEEQAATRKVSDRAQRGYSNVDDRNVWDS